MGRTWVILIALHLVSCSQEKPENATGTALAEAPSTQAPPPKAVIAEPKPAPTEAKPPPVLGDPYGLLSKGGKKKKIDPSTLDPGALSKTPEPAAPRASTGVQRDPRAVARASKPLPPPASSFAPVKAR